jgi:hypothetical protein
MARNSTVHEVLIASPGDVVEERKLLSEVVEDWNAAHARETRKILQARRWELDARPELGDRPQGIINKQLVDEADLLIAVFSTRLGSPTGVSASGTVEEIERCRSMGKPVFVYFSKAPIPRDHDPEQLRLLNEYKRELSDIGVYFEFGSQQDLWRLASRHLAGTMARMPSVSAARHPHELPPPAEVSVEEQQMDRSGGVRVMPVSVALKNLSDVKRITEYMLTLSVPSACMTHSSAGYMGEVRPSPPGRRVFRKTEAESRAILPGESIKFFRVDLAVDQLKMPEPQLKGDIRAVLADKVTVEAVVQGVKFTAEKPISEIFKTIYPDPDKA